jgi:multisubunit Na+/H+ antiporter MnhB subunit
VDNGFQQSIVGKLATEMMAMIKKEKEDAARIKLRKLDVLIIALSGTGLLAFGLKLLFDFLNR